MIKHVNYQIRNIPFLVSETENVVPDAPLTNYPGEDFFEKRCKITAFLGHDKIFDATANAYKSVIYKRKKRLSKLHSKSKKEKTNRSAKNPNQKGGPIGNLYKNQIDHLKNENEKNNPLD